MKGVFASSEAQLFVGALCVLKLSDLKVLWRVERERQGNNGNCKVMEARTDMPNPFSVLEEHWRASGTRG